MTFKAIETQEQLDAIVQERVKREKETLQQKYADYDDIKSEKENLEQQIIDLNNSLTATNEKYAQYEENVSTLNKTIDDYKTKDLKTRIAMEHKIPFELAGRLSGATEEEIRKDAEALSGFVSQKTPLPLGSTEPSEIDSEEKAYKATLKNLTSKGD